MLKKSRSKTEIEAEIRHHVAAEEEAYRWVEYMAVVESISRTELMKMINKIMTSHYHDITEERSISKLCGYPLCSNKLEKVSKQKFHISLKSNKVYDMGERKFFCCGYCFKASKYIEDQIPESPIWLRSESNFREPKLLQREDKTNVLDSQNVLSEYRIRVEDIENVSFDENSQHEQIEREEEYSIPEKENIYKQNKERRKTPYTIKLIDPKTVQQEKQQCFIKLIDGKSVSRADSNNESMLEQLRKLSSILDEWFSDKTYMFLRGDLTISTFKNKNSKLYEEDRKCVQSKAFNFLSKNPEWVKECDTTSSFRKKLNLSENNTVEEVPVCLPTIDSKSQNIIRRRIVKEKLSTGFKKLLPVFGIMNSDLVESGFYKFVDTFRFTSQNIVLKPKQWLSITLVVFKIFSVSKRLFLDILDSSAESLDNFLLQQNIIDLETIDNIVEEIISEKVSVDDDGGNTESENILFRDIISEKSSKGGNFDLEELD